MLKQETRGFQLNYFFSTYISAFASRIPVLPLERLILLQQTNRIDQYKSKIGHNSNLRYLITIARKEGFTSIFRGNLTLLCRILPNTGLEFYLFNKFNSNIPKILTINQKLSFFLSGSLAGTLAYLLVYPLEFSRIMVGMNKAPTNLNPLQIVHYLYKKQGLFNLYRGSLFSCLCVFPYAGFKFFFFEQNKIILENYNKRELSVYDRIIAAALSGIFAQTLVYPIEIMGKRKIAQVFCNESKEMGYKDLMKFILKNGGIKQFTNGIIANYQKVMIINSIGLVLNDYFKSKFER